MADVAIKRECVENGVEGYRLFVWCPGCEDVHAASGSWEWNGRLDEEFTISPSLLVNSNQWAEGEPWHKPQHTVPAGAQTVCHSFISNGQWQFLGDCTHALAGQIVPMVPVPSDARGVLW